MPNSKLKLKPCTIKTEDFRNAQDDLVTHIQYKLRHNVNIDAVIATELAVSAIGLIELLIENDPRIVVNDGPDVIEDDPDGVEFFTMKEGGQEFKLGQSSTDTDR